jgi:hypothetical protein
MGPSTSELFAKPPSIEKIDGIAEKLPDSSAQKAA